MSSRVASGWLRFALSLLLLGLAGGVLGGSSCHWDDDDYCDDDDRFDDDDDDFDDDDFYCDDDDDVDVVIGTLPSEEPALELTDFRLQTGAAEQGHPVRGVLDIRGISLFGVLGPGDHGTRELRYFTSQVLQANPALFGLPPQAGRLVFEGVERLAGTVVVTYVQELQRPGDARLRVAGAKLHFVLDGLGNLLQVHNFTVLEPDEAQLVEVGPDDR